MVCGLHRGHYPPEDMRAIHHPNDQVGDAAEDRQEEK